MSQGTQVGSSLQRQHCQPDEEVRSYGFHGRYPGSIHWGEQVNIPNRKRIAMAMETFNGFGSTEKNQIYEYIKEYCPNLSDGDNCFTVKNNEDLTIVLYGIEQWFYTTLIGQEKRIANFVIKM